MGAKELKDKIQDYLDKADEHVLNIVNSVFENYYDDETVAFHPDGSPMSRKEYKSSLGTSKNQYVNEDYTSIEDIESEDF